MDRIRVEYRFGPKGAWLPFPGEVAAAGFTGGDGVIFDLRLKEPGYFRPPVEDIEIRVTDGIRESVFGAKLGNWQGWRGWASLIFYLDAVPDWRLAEPKTPVEKANPWKRLADEGCG